MKTAQALGITFPREIMLQVTEVIHTKAPASPPRSGPHKSSQEATGALRRWEPRPLAEYRRSGYDERH
jgi:hypothetical protein